MIHDELVTYEGAKLAKEKGFNEGCLFYYQNGVTESDGCYNHYNMGNKKICSAPTQSLLQRWLREEKGVIIQVNWMHDCGKYFYTIWTNDKCIVSDYIKLEKAYDTYEQALEDALRYALENLV